MSAKLPLAQTLEALLFVSSEPVTPDQLASILELPLPDIEIALVKLEQNLQSRGLRLIASHGHYSLVTHPDCTQAVEKFLGQQVKTELTKPALETLAVIAYRQPATRSQIEQIRGVSSEQTLRSLLARGLITESPSKEGAKVYCTSLRFLQHFGLSKPADLPPLGTNSSHSDST